MSLLVRGKIKNGNIVFSKPLPLPEGSEVTVHIDSPGARGESAPDLGGSDLQKLAFFGVWSDRPEMTDSRDWVRTERERWQQRLVRRD